MSRLSAGGREQLQRLSQAGELELGPHAELVGEREPVHRAVAVAGREARQRLVGVDRRGLDVDDRLHRHREALAAAEALERGLRAALRVAGGDRGAVVDADRRRCRGAWSTAGRRPPRRAAPRRRCRRAARARSRRMPRRPAVASAAISRRATGVGVVAEDEGGELVAADPPEQVVVAQRRRLIAVGRVDQQPVAGGMAEALVDGAEVVEVDRDQRRRAARRSRARSASRSGRAARRGRAAR